MANLLGPQRKPISLLTRCRPEKGPFTAHLDHRFDPANRACLLDPERARYLPAREILAKFPLKGRMAAADIGCGPGYWTIPMAEITGRSGRVFAVDLEEAMLADLRARIAPRTDITIEVARSTEDHIPLPDGSVDFAFLACVLHELAGPGTLHEAARILRRGGALGVVDWKKKRQLMGPPYGHRLSPARAEEVSPRVRFRWMGPKSCPGNLRIIYMSGDMISRAASYAPTRASNWLSPPRRSRRGQCDGERITTQHHEREQGSRARCQCRVRGTRRHTPC